MKNSIRASLAMACISLMALPGFTEEVRVTITTIAPENGVFLTPMWLGFHDGAFDIYDQDATVSAMLERLTEDGNTAPFSDEFAAASPNGIQATLPGPGPGPLFSGVTVSHIVDLMPGYHRYFSYASMVIPSNDAFVANGNPMAHRIFDPDGNFTPITFYILGNQVLDAGTEVNDELESSTAALGQAAPDTGTDQNGVVTLHPGFIPGDRILTARPDGQFLDPGYRLAKVTIDQAPRTRVTFSGSGAQELPAVTTDATAACSAMLNSAGDKLTVSCHHNVMNIQAAHVHTAIAGENGAVRFTFASLDSPINETFDATVDDVADFLEGNFYVNLHSTEVPSGEVRAQIDGCFEGPEGLCLLNERFQVTAMFTVGGDGGPAQAIEATSDSGQFTFFAPDNVELDIKVLDGCGVNGSYWVFIAGLTDVGVDITVTDTATDTTRSYSNPEGTAFELIQDIGAFSCN